MHRILPDKTYLLMLFLVFTSANVLGQTQGEPAKQDDAAKKVNFRYSQNPKVNSKEKGKDQNKEGNSVANEKGSSESEKASKTQGTVANDAGNQAPEVASRSDGLSIASKTMEIAKRASRSELPPTEIYKVGIGDVLFVSLQNAPSGSTTYFTVLNDGTIDYPLAAGTVEVLGLTTDEIEELLEGKIKIFEDPQIAVRVREYGSHSISVIGLVEKPGVKLLQREALPLFVVRAEAIVKPNANKVVIRRSNLVTETYDLKIEKNENILIFPGDIVEFLGTAETAAAVETPRFYYIGGNVRNIGRKDFYAGITLSQAILSSGGLRKAKDSSVVVRRKNSEGKLESAAYDLNEIKDGKIPDPQLEAGDTVEVGN